MLMLDWLFILYGFLGLLSMLSAVYEWIWFWKLARGVYLPDLIGLRNSRLFYLSGGFGGVGAGISHVLQFLLSSNSVFIIIVGYSLSGALTALWFNSRKNQSIVKFLLNKENE